MVIRQLLDRQRRNRKQIEPTRPEVVVHVGAHKTATSLVQHYMRDRPEDLRPWDLLYVPRSDCNGLIRWGERLRDSPELLRNRVAAELSKPAVRTVIVSHENTIGPPFVDTRPILYPEAHRNMRALAAILDGYHCKIFLSIRPPEGFLQSYYLQYVHEGGHVTFAEWLAAIDTSRLSWKPAVCAAIDAFGAGAVEVIDFRGVRRGQKSFLQDFFRRIDPSIAIEPDFKSHRNASVSAEGLEIALKCNPHLSTTEQRKAFRKFLQGHFSNRSQPRPILLGETREAALAREYQAEYEELVTLRGQELEQAVAGYSLRPCPPIEPPGPNLALGRPARQSSRYRETRRFGPAGAVNGEKSGSFGFHTALEVNPWWQVDLESTHRLREIHLYNRTELGFERAFDLLLRVSEDGEQWSTVHRQGGEPFGGVGGRPAVVRLDGVPARFVRVERELEREGFLHLDEVEVYGEPAANSEANDRSG